jgi:hypothetical protein
VSEPYADWNADELRSEIIALVASIETLEAERDRLRDGIMSAEVHGELIVRMRESVWLKHEADRDRLRAVVEDPDGAIEAMHARLDEVQREQTLLIAERVRLRAVVEHAIETLSESAASAPGVLATVDLMRLALDPTGEDT